LKTSTKNSTTSLREQSPTRRLPTFYYDERLPPPPPPTSNNNKKSASKQSLQFNKTSTQNDDTNASADENPIYQFRKREVSSKEDGQKKKAEVSHKSSDQKLRKRSKSPKQNGTKRSSSSIRDYKKHKIPYKYVLNTRLKRLNENLNCKLNMNLILILLVFGVLSILLIIQVLSKYTQSKFIEISVNQKRLASNRRIF
jgi:hypothetical protein